MNRILVGKIRGLKQKMKGVRGGGGGGQRKAETMAEEERVEVYESAVLSPKAFSKSNLLKSATPTENLASY